MLNKKKILSFIYFLLALLPLVSAQPLAMPGGIGPMIENFFRSFFDLLGRQMVLAGIVFIAFFTIQYSIFVATAKKIKIFSGDGGINNQGIALSVALSALSTLGIFYSTGETLFVMVERVLTFGSTLGIFLLAVTVFLFVYYKSNLKEKRNGWLAVVAAGITIIIMSYLVDPSWSIIGAIIALIGAIGLIAQAFGLFKDLSFGGGGSKGGKSGKGGGSKTGKSGVPKEKYGTVNVSVTDGTGRPIDNIDVETKRRIRGWVLRGRTSGGNPLTFNEKIGWRSIRAVYGGSVRNTKKVYITPGDNNINLSIGSGPGGSGSLNGRVTDGIDGLINVTVKWNGLSTKTDKNGNYSIKVNPSYFGKSKINASGTLLTNYTSPDEILVDPSNLNASYDFQMVVLSKLDVEIEYDYGGGYTKHLIPGHTNVTVRIRSTTNPFTRHPYINRYKLYKNDGTLLSLHNESAVNLKYLDPNNYEINNLDTSNCGYCRYYFR